MHLEASKNALARYGCVRTMNFIQSQAGSPVEDPVRAAADLDAVMRDSRILVVDDQKMVRELLKIYLTNGGYENLLFAGDGDEALDMIAAEGSGPCRPRSADAPDERAGCLQGTACRPEI